MKEYRKHLSSILIPDSEREYYLALNKAYNNTLLKLNKIENKLSKGQVSSLGTEWQWSRTQLTSLLNSIEDELKGLSSDFRTDFKKDIVNITHTDHKASIEEMGYTLEAGGVVANLQKINKEKIAKLIKTDTIIFSYKTKQGVKKSSVNVRSLLDSPTQNAIKKVKSIMTAGAIAGDNPMKIARDIKHEFVSVNKHHTRTIIRTLIAEAQESADKEMYRLNDEYIGHYKFIATLDTRTTSVCRGLDGRNFTEYPKISLTPPLHHNCRSSIVQIPKGYKPNERPLNLMTAKDKKTARSIKDKHEREAFLKTKIFTIDGNLTYSEAEKLYPALKNSKSINYNQYVEKLGIE